MPVILHINAVANYGSTGKIMENIGLLAQKRGWTSYIAHGGRYSQPSKLNSFCISSVTQNRLAVLHTLLTDRHGFALKHTTKRFIRWVDTINPDIVHLHNIHSYYINVELLFEYLRMRNIPIVWTLHDCWAFTGHCSHFIMVNCNKWETGCYECPLKHAFPRTLLLDRSSKNFYDKKHIFTSVSNMKIITVSEWLSNMVKKSFLSKYSVDVINNGIDTKIFKPTDATDLKLRYGLNDKFILIAVSTCWCKSKGLDDYLELRKRLNKDYEIILIGMTSKQIMQYKSSGIICIAKTQSQYELAQWYSLANIVMNLSYAETFGLPVVEGFACGTPAIVYDDTALPELVTPETGISVTTGNLDEVIKAIDTIRGNKKSLYSEACIRRVRERYDKENNYNKYINLYDTMIHNC